MEASLNTSLAKKFYEYILNINLEVLRQHMNFCSFENKVFPKYIYIMDISSKKINKTLLIIYENVLP